VPRINEAFLNLRASYLFAEVKRRTQAHRDAHPGVRLIDLGIGDVTLPLPEVVVQALVDAAREQARAETLRGYGPYVGYEFLRAEIAAQDFGTRGVKLGPDEVFVSDGGKSDAANIQELFAQDAVVALMDPAYPVYADANVMAGRSGPAEASGRYPGFVYLPCTAENDFQPALPDRHVDLIYLCYPNNPTGAVMTRAALKRWVDYARAQEAVIVYDAAYEAYIRDPELPHSIYEVEGAREVAIESRSFSKNAGFTGLRMAYTVVPREVQGRTAAGNAVSLNQLWLRRQSTKSNGPPYVIQRAAAAVYTPEGQKQVRGLIDQYMENARILREGLERAGLTVYGGRNAPYIWIRTPAGVSSWDFFDRLLAEANVVGVPGSGFGPSGEGYFRVTAFGSLADSAEAVERIASRLRGAG
jgi:LL-diaminopimelate aminotransferase